MATEPRVSAAALLLHGEGGWNPLKLSQVQQAGHAALPAHSLQVQSRSTVSSGNAQIFKHSQELQLCAGPMLWMMQ